LDEIYCSKWVNSGQSSTAGQAYRRGRAASARIASKPTSYTATAPNQVWSWDVTWLPSSVKGQFYKLYLIEDIFSRFPVGWEVHDEETGELAAELVQRSVLAQRCANRPLVLHSDNGAPMKSYTLKAKMEALGIVASHSRPRVSNDNPFSESLFKTLKYWPRWPRKGFATIEIARQWVQRFIQWYSHEHRHSGIQFVTPASGITGKIKTSWYAAMPSIRPPATHIPSDGAVPPETGNGSIRCSSTRIGKCSCKLKRNVSLLD
jgi:putative transposase